jgi:type IV pilus assembly protein PilW
MKPRNFAGRSLVEVMIALTLGMLVLIAVSSLFIGNRGTYRALDEKSRLDEEGRLALHLLAQHVRMAGYGTLNNQTKAFDSHPIVSGAENVNVVIPAVFTRFNRVSSEMMHGNSEDAVRGCKNGFVDLKSIPSAMACKTSNESDALMVRYEVDIASGNTTAGNIPTDCLGNAISPTIVPDSGESFFIIDNRFFVQENPTTKVNELYCQGNGNTDGYPNSPLKNSAQPIAENVQEMRITYGLLAPAVDAEGLERNPNLFFSQAINQYVTADKVTNWNQVAALRICLVVRSANQNVASRPQQYKDCSDQLQTPTDRFLRSVFISTIAIRSRTIGAGT